MYIVLQHTTNQYGLANELYYRTLTGIQENFKFSQLRIPMRALHNRQDMKDCDIRFYLILE